MPPAHHQFGEIADEVGVLQLALVDQVLLQHGVDAFGAEQRPDLTQARLTRLTGTRTGGSVSQWWWWPSGGDARGRAGDRVGVVAAGTGQRQRRGGGGRGESSSRSLDGGNWSH